MYSQTFVARDLFSQYWAIVTCGFLLDCAAITNESDGLVEFVSVRRQGHLRFLELVSEYTRLDPLVMKIADEAAPWTAKPPLDGSYFALDVSLMVGRLVGVDELEGESRFVLVTEAASASVVRFVDAFFESVFAFGGASVSVVEQCARVLAELAGLVGHSAQLGGVVRNGLKLWFNERFLVTLELATPPFRVWLESLRLSEDV